LGIACVVSASFSVTRFFQKEVEMVRIKLTGMLAASALATAFAVAGAAPALAAPANFTCNGGSVPGGTYVNLTVTGFCAIASGDVTVEHDVTVTATGALIGRVAGSTLTIGHNLVVGQGGSALLGCLADDDCGGAFSDKINGSVMSTGAMFLVIHNDVISGQVSVSGGSAKYDCSNFAFTDFDVNKIGGNVSITGLNTCWDGFSNNAVGGSVLFDNNVTLIVEAPPVGPDGNFVGGNVIGGSLSCSGNSPTPHLSDEVPIPNSVSGHTVGQCVGEV
jgi:hypothetical protein